MREQWTKKRPDLLPKPEQQSPGKVKPVQSENDRLPSRPHLNIASAVKPTRPGSQSIGPNSLHGHSQLTGISGSSSNQGFGRPSSFSLSNSRPKPKPMGHLNEYSQEDDSNEHALDQGQSQKRPSTNNHPGRPGSQQNHANSLVKPGRRPSKRPSIRTTRRPLRPRPEYSSYHDEQYSDYPDQQYYQEDYDQYHDYPDEYPEEEYSDEYEEEEYPSRPVTLRPRPPQSSGGGLLSKLVGFVGKLLI